MNTDDCFAIDHRLLTLSDAFSLIAERVTPVTGTERVALADCAGRVLAEPLMASVTQPPFDNSAMDGFAIRLSDLESGNRRLKVAARIAAGHPESAAPPAGSAVEIFTGAPLPAGFDTVVMVEDCQRDGDFVILPDKIKPHAHVRLAGIDFKQGDSLLTPGRRLLPQDIGLAAATGATKLAVRKRLKVGLFSTGDELVIPGAPLQPGQIYDSNRPMLKAALQAMGFEVTDLGHLPDKIETLITAFGLAALDQDALISTGGVSVGGEDHVRAAIESLGQIFFWKLAMKPGKPLALGHIGEATFIGLPGNPVSSLISLLVIGRTVLHGLAGAGQEAALPAGVTVPAAADLGIPGNRTNFIRGRLEAHNGQLAALPYFSQDSSLISSLTGSSGLIELTAGDRSVAAGTPVLYRAYESMMR
jgi:molybdopterin molybdotransferase